MKNYSQSNEQSVILEYFKEFTPGTFLDLGANDGETFSNTRALALSGWRGVLVDCSPTAFEKLKTLYNGHKGFYLYQYAIEGHNGKKIFQNSGALCSDADTGLVGTFYPEEKARFDKKVEYSPVEVKTFKWKTFLNRLRIKEFDFISMDVEGSEVEILPSMDLTKTKMICIEWNSKPDLKQWYELHLQEFKLIYTSGENLIYAR